MTEVPNERGRRRRFIWLFYLWLAINAVALALALIFDPPSSIGGWLGALFLELVLVLALVGNAYVQAR